jgi:hypothetical protein
MDVQYLLLENPWPVAGTAAVAAVFVYWWQLNSGARPLTRRLLQVLPATAVGVVAAAYFVQTDREAITAAMEEICVAAERRDADGLLRHFALPETSDGGDVWTQPRFSGAVTSKITWVSRCRMHDAERIDFRPDGRAVAPLQAAVYSDGGPVVVRAELTWEKRDGRWRVTGLANPGWRIGTGSFRPVR